MTNPFASQAPPAPNPFGQPAPSPFSQPAAPAGFGQPAAGPNGASPFGLAPPPGTGEAAGPRMRDYGPGRLVLVWPKLIEVVPNTLSQVQGATQQRITADIVALDGQPIHWGGAPEKMPSVPHNKVLPVGTLVEDMFIGQQELVKTLKHFLPPARPSILLARLSVGITKKQGNNPPWQFDSATVTEADKALANQWLTANPRTPFGTAN